MNTGHGTLRMRSLWVQLGKAGRIALAVTALALLVVVLSSRGIIGALLTPAAGAAGAGAGDLNQREEQFKKNFDGQLAQINGRSMIFKPLPPPKPDEPDQGPKVDQPPTHYAGPALVGFVNGIAYFADGRKLAPGDGASGSLKVTAINPPWSATVEWQGVEFTVSLFDRDKVVFKEADAAATPATSEAQAKKDDKPEPASPPKAETAESRPPASPADGPASPPPSEPPKTAAPQPANQPETTSPAPESRDADRR